MSTQARNVALDHLRTFLTLLVVAHHAVLAYHPYAPPRPASLGESQIWGAFPVVDSVRWPGIDLFVGFNDTFFMSLLFLISGVFAFSALERKGASRFVRDRVTKLGLAFLVSAAVLAPLAYYPTYLSLEAQSVSFVRQWLSLGSWPAGPAWFLWVLIVFAGTAALVHSSARGAYAALGRLGERPLVFLLALVALSAVAYLPLAQAFTGFHWSSFGPFYVQTSRVLLYAVYFFAGMALGAQGTGSGLLAPDRRLARRWPLWVVASVLTFALNVAVFVVAVLPKLGTGGPGLVAGAASGLAFVLTCAATSLACIALFVRFAKRRNPVADSLSANAFGIYLLHYFCVSWLQWLLLPVTLSGAAKGTIVFLGAVSLSWALTALVRRSLFLRSDAASPVAALQDASFKTSR